jgi:hypothetical protein
MPRNQIIFDDEYFNRICETYFEAPIESMREKLNAATEIFGEENSTSKIERLYHEDSRFIMLVDLRKDLLGPMPGNDLKFCGIFPREISFKDFFRCIHPAYLKAYLEFGALAYQVAPTAGLKDLFSLKYQISIPLRLPNNGDVYEWYTQKSFTLSVSDSRQIISHLNVYEYQHRSYLNGETIREVEHRFVEASVIKDGKPYGPFQSIIDNYRMQEILSDLPINQREVIVATMYQLPNKKITERLNSNLEKNYSEDSLKDIRSEIITRFIEETGYKFNNIFDVIRFLKEKGVKPDDLKPIA